MRRHAWNCDLSTKTETDILTNRHLYIYIDVPNGPLSRWLLLAGVLYPGHLRSFSCDVWASSPPCCARTLSIEGLSSARLYMLESACPRNYPDNIDSLYTTTAELKPLCLLLQVLNVLAPVEGLHIGLSEEDCSH